NIDLSEHIDMRLARDRLSCDQHSRVAGAACVGVRSATRASRFRAKRGARQRPRRQLRQSPGETEMNQTARLTILASAAILLAWSAGAQAQQANMSFFVTSTGGGKGADLGGRAGADARCHQLAQTAGAGAKTWHAYLSTQAASGQSAVNARDRIGNGPWQNAKGVVIAKNLDELHSQTNNLTKQTALTEKGDLVKGRGD